MQRTIRKANGSITVMGERGIVGNLSADVFAPVPAATVTFAPEFSPLHPDDATADEQLHALVAIVDIDTCDVISQHRNASDVTLRALLDVRPTDGAIWEQVAWHVNASVDTLERIADGPHADAARAAVTVLAARDH